MACQEVAFAAAKCRIQIAPASKRRGVRDFVARMSVIDESTGTIRPLLALDGEPAEVHAETEGRALGEAIAFLERRLGSSRRVALLRDRPPLLPVGDPITVAE